ncbi:uncharacterized protein EV422DRAFT_521106 [Fimicolochytrium jonesii]|uniref:uncharacterized protein n=1 Tax=Fimicolochytrium jonesii TaxID=1396493 RepID=UPI0022FDB855|nr:uncharacterized protein EV422DRAFT_521106 [Fimicolochytrium jonesii]KAI8823457.1 hypothetical protein EV422DRAFT_521106 [Fimicolochytrium jonesii]
MDWPPPPIGRHASTSTGGSKKQDSELAFDDADLDDLLLSSSDDEKNVKSKEAEKPKSAPTPIPTVRPTTAASGAKSTFATPAPATRQFQAPPTPASAEKPAPAILPPTPVAASAHGKNNVDDILKGLEDLDDLDGGLFGGIGAGTKKGAAAAGPASIQNSPAKPSPTIPTAATSTTPAVLPSTLPKTLAAPKPFASSAPNTPVTSAKPLMPWEKRVTEDTMPSPDKPSPSLAGRDRSASMGSSQTSAGPNIARAQKPLMPWEKRTDTVPSASSAPSVPAPVADTAALRTAADDTSLFMGSSTRTRNRSPSAKSNTTQFTSEADDDDDILGLLSFDGPSKNAGRPRSRTTSAIPAAGGLFGSAPLGQSDAKPALASPARPFTAPASSPAPFSSSTPFTPTPMTAAPATTTTANPFLFPPTTTKPAATPAPGSPAKSFLPSSASVSTMGTLRTLELPRTSAKEDDEFVPSFLFETSGRARGGRPRMAEATPGIEPPALKHTPIISLPFLDSKPKMTPKPEPVKAAVPVSLPPAAAEPAKPTEKAKGATTTLPSAYVTKADGQKQRQQQQQQTKTILSLPAGDPIATKPRDTTNPSPTSNDEDGEDDESDLQDIGLSDLELSPSSGDEEDNPLPKRRRRSSVSSVRSSRRSSVRGSRRGSKAVLVDTAQVKELQQKLETAEKDEKEMQDFVETLKKEKAELKADLDKVKKNVQEVEQKAKKIEEDSAAALTKLKDAHEEEIEHLKKRHEDELARQHETLTATHKEATKHLAEAHAAELVTVLSRTNELTTLATQIQSRDQAVTDLQKKVETDHAYSIKERELAFQNREKQISEMQRHFLDQQKELDEERVKIQELVRTMDENMHAAQRQQSEAYKRLMNDKTRLQEQMQDMQAEKHTLLAHLHTDRVELLKQKEEWALEKRRQTQQLDGERTALALERSELESLKHTLQVLQSDLATHKLREEAQLHADRIVFERDQQALVNKAAVVHREMAQLRSERCLLEAEKGKLGVEREVFEVGREEAERVVREVGKVGEVAVTERHKAEELLSSTVETQQSLEAALAKIRSDQAALLAQQTEVRKERLALAHERYKAGPAKSHQQQAIGEKDEPTLVLPVAADAYGHRHLTPNAREDKHQPATPAYVWGITPSSALYTLPKPQNLHVIAARDLFRKLDRFVGGLKQSETSLDRQLAYLTTARQAHPHVY